MKVCIVTHVSSDRDTSERSYHSYRSLGFPIFWVCFNQIGIDHAKNHYSGTRGDTIVDYSNPPFADMFLNEASYCFFSEFGPAIWSSFDAVAIPQDDVAYGNPTDLAAMANIMLTEGIVLAMPSLFDGPNLTMPHVATQLKKGLLRRYSTFIEELGWVVNTQIMPLRYFTLSYCYSKVIWGREFFLCANLIHRFGPFSCVIFDQFPAHHLRMPLTRHGDMDATRLYRRMRDRFGVRHPGEECNKIARKECYVSIPLDLAYRDSDGKMKVLMNISEPLFVGGDRGQPIPIHPDYWLPRKYGTENTLKQLLETDSEHIDYRDLDACMAKKLGDNVAVRNNAGNRC